MLLLKGAKLNDTSILTKEILDEINKTYNLTSQTVFVNKDFVSTPVGSLNMRSTKFEGTKEDPSIRNLVFDKFEYILKQNTEKTYDIIGLKIRKTGKEIGAEALHYSISPDLMRFSITVFFFDENHRETLIVSHYSKSLGKPLIQIESRGFNYLSNRSGHPIRWDKTEKIKLNTCGLSESDLDLSKQSIAIWNQALLGLATIEIDEQINENFPPFSDVNLTCIYTIDTYLISSKKNSFAYGAATLVANSLNNATHGNVMIFNQEFKKASEYLSKRDLLLDRFGTFLHELGHILGLQHKQDGVKSIMSYSHKPKLDKEDALSDYDIRAIQNLYQQ